MERATLEAVKDGTLDEKEIDAAVERILRLAFRSGEREKGSGVFDVDAHDALACAVAEQGAVLLKNEGGLHRPEKELKGFIRAELQPGESKRVEFTLDERSFSVWDNGWKVPGGRAEKRAVYYG